MATLNDKYGISELRQGGNKSLAQGLEEYLNPEFAEPNTLRKFIGNAVSNAREMVGMDEESLARNQELQSASQKLFDYTLGRKKGQSLSPEERADLEAKDREYAVNLGSLSPAVGTVKAVISPEERAKNLAKFMEGSKVPEPVYHQTSKENARSIFESGFDTDKLGARISDEQMPNGIFLKDTDKDIGLTRGEPEQMKLHVNIKKPLHVKNRTDLLNELSGDDEYTRLKNEHDAIDLWYKKKFNQAWSEPETDDKLDMLDAITEEWNAESRNAATLARNRATEYIKSLGYDGLIVDFDLGTHGRSTKTIVQFSPNQIKSATGNRGTYDPNDPNILHSLAPIGALGGLGSLYGTNEGDR